MGENKEYVIHSEEKGSINISEDVIAAIAASAALEVEGVAGLSGPLGKEIVEFLGGKKNAAKGVKVSGEGNDVIIDVFAIVQVGYPVYEIAAKVQEAVDAAVESMTGFTAKNINVTICGIALDK